MKTKTSIVLGVVALVLAAFIYFFEQHQPTTDDLEERSDRILPGFDRDRVDKIVIGKGEGRVELSRIADEEEGDAGPAGSVGSWRLDHPIEVDADAEAVDSLLSSIDWLSRRRSFDEEGAAGAAKFGLQEPRAQIMIQLRGREVTLKVGGDAPGQGLYLALGDEENKVFVVDQEFLEQISKEPNDLRDRQLVSITSSRVQAARVTGRFHAQRVGEDRWTLITPIKMRAEGRRVDDVIRALEQLRAKRFIADDVEEGQLGQYGLDRPFREAQLRLDDEGHEALTLRFGNTCEGQSEEVYATVVGRGTVTCVERTALDGLDVQPEELRDLKTTRFTIDDLESIEISRSEQKILLRRDEEIWRIGEEGDEGEETPEADQEATEAFINQFNSAVATDVVTDLAPLGLEGDEPRADVTIRLIPVEDESDDRETEILYFAVGPTGLFLRRGDEGVALALPADLAEELAIEELKFKKRQILDHDPAGAMEIEVISAGPPASRQLIQKHDNRWRLEAPFEFMADEVVVDHILRDVSTLRAERYVSMSPLGEHGLTRPDIRLRVRFEESGDEEVDGGARDGIDEVILLGASTDGGRYARLEGEDQVVFVISETFAERLERPLIDRDLFTVHEDEVLGLVVQRGTDQVDVERVGSDWQRDGEPVPADAIAGILARLAIARASEVFTFGAPAPNAGLASPRARLVLRISGGEAEQNEERTIAIGAQYGEEETPRVYVRREDVNATFGLPLRAVQPILTFDLEPETHVDAGVVGVADGGGG